MSTASETTNPTSQENHRSALDELIGDVNPAPVITPETPITPVPENKQEDPAPDADPTKTVDPPAPEPEKAKEDPAPAAPSTDIYQSLAEISNGLVKNEEDFKGTISKVAQYTDLESKYNAQTEELKAIKEVKPFANPYLEKLNELYKSGADQNKIDLFQRINALGDTKDLSSKDALKWQLREQYGLTDEQAETKIRNSYKTDDTVYTEDDVKAANVDMLIDGNKAKEYLKGLQVSFETPAPTPAAPTETPEQIATKARDFEAKVVPVVSIIDQELPGYFTGINSNGLEGDKANTVDLPVPADIKSEVTAEVKQFAINNQIDITNPEHIQALKDYAKNLTVIKMWPKWIVDASNKTDAALRAEFNNTDSIDRGKANPDAPQKTTREQAAANVAETM